ncbi:hypothetical protein ACODT5_28715 [Streptomyces sp. 5.8]|uniref:hypothetical protein n=1 Tax=Streptomyces sp. 5.8 TaxID=3406571 RepID=UPI003BB4AFFC
MRKRLAFLIAALTPLALVASPVRADTTTTWMSFALTFDVALIRGTIPYTCSDSAPMPAAALADGQEFDRQLTEAFTDESKLPAQVQVPAFYPENPNPGAIANATMTNSEAANMACPRTDTPTRLYRPLNTIVHVKVPATTASGARYFPEPDNMRNWLQQDFTFKALNNAYDLSISLRDIRAINSSCGITETATGKAALNWTCPDPYGTRTLPYYSRGLTYGRGTIFSVQEGGSIVMDLRAQDAAYPAAQDPAGLEWDFLLGKRTANGGWCREYSWKLAPNRALGSVHYITVNASDVDTSHAPDGCADRTDTIGSTKLLDLVRIDKSFTRP